MKNLLTTLLLLVGVSAFGQGTAIRSQNGFGTNTSFYGTTTNATINQMGSSVLGSLWTLLDTNGLNRIAIVSTNMTFRDTNNIQLRISPNGVEAVTVGFVGNGAGLTNLVGATNFSSTVTYNFNGKVTFNSVSYNTNLWSGPTNTLVLTTNYQDFITTTDCNITNVGGQLAGQNTWTTLTISNASAGDITVRSTAAGLRPQGSSTTAALVIGAGKEGILSYLSRDFKSTNYVTTAQQ